MNWKLKLRYGKVSTKFIHKTVLADGIAGKLLDGFECRPGRAWMSMKVWTINDDQAADMISVIGGKIGFKVDGKIEIYDTEPNEPPKENPYGYDIRFTAYKDESAQQADAPEPLTRPGDP